MAYNYSKNLRRPFAEVVMKVRENLQHEGFNIINTVDMKQQLRLRLDVVFRNYVIISACHTMLSYRAISLEPHVGVLLPCNIVVQEHENGEVEVSAVNPLESLDQNMVTPSLELIAFNMSNHLRAALDDLRSLKERPSLAYS
jgi:uncharacterized protein (DUF302 family)